MHTSFDLTALFSKRKRLRKTYPEKQGEGNVKQPYLRIPLHNSTKYYYIDNDSQNG